MKIKVSIVYKFYKNNIRIKWNWHNKTTLKNRFNEWKIVNHNGKTHKNDVNKTPKIVHLNKLEHVELHILVYDACMHDSIDNQALNK